MASTRCTEKAFYLRMRPNIQHCLTREAPPLASSFSVSSAMNETKSAGAAYVPWITRGSETNASKLWTICGSQDQECAGTSLLTG